MNEAAPAQPSKEQADLMMALRRRERRQAVFRAHVLHCATCASDEKELCEVGYRLLRKATREDSV